MRPLSPIAIRKDTLGFFKLALKNIYLLLNYFYYGDLFPFGDIYYFTFNLQLHRYLIYGGTPITSDIIS